jgi:ribosomal protein S18 acetylase RimI-like enzyme
LAGTLIVAAKAEIAPVAASDPVEIRTLTPDDVKELRLGWRTRLHPDEILQILNVYPGRSVWAPETLEFAIAGPWRHRQEIANIQELSAVRHPEQLVEGIVDRARAGGAALVLSIELDETRRTNFYDRVGFSLVEEVITFDLVPPAFQYPSPLRLRYERADIAAPGTIERLCAIDNAAFPWLWWNCSLEFEAYALTPSVELYIGYSGDEPVSYIGITSYAGWGHLDRIAVVPRYQGAGYGLDSLDFAVRALIRQGARRIGLSTQRQNLRSQQIYERFGFRRSQTNDYRLYGRYLVEPESLGTDSG